MICHAAWCETKLVAFLSIFHKTCDRQKKCSFTPRISGWPCFAQWYPPFWLIPMHEMPLPCAARCNAVCLAQGTVLESEGVTVVGRCAPSPHCLDIAFSSFEVRWGRSWPVGTGLGGLAVYLINDGLREMSEFRATVASTLPTLYSLRVTGDLVQNTNGERDQCFAGLLSFYPRSRACHIFPHLPGEGC